MDWKIVKLFVQHVNFKLFWTFQFVTISLCACASNKPINFRRTWTTYNFSGRVTCFWGRVSATPQDFSLSYLPRSSLIAPAPSESYNWNGDDCSFYTFFVKGNKLWTRNSFSVLFDTTYLWPSISRIESTLARWDSSSTRCCTRRSMKVSKARGAP